MSWVTTMMVFSSCRLATSLISRAHVLHGDGVEPGEGLVHQQEVLAAHELLGDGHALPLAARELAGVEAGAVLQPEALQEAQGLLAARPRRRGRPGARPPSGCPAPCGAANSGYCWATTPTIPRSTGTPFSPISTCPRVRLVRPARMRKKQVLPMPEGPSRPTHLARHLARAVEVLHLQVHVAQDQVAAQGRARRPSPSGWSRRTRRHGARRRRRHQRRSRVSVGVGAATRRFRAPMP